LAIGGKKLFEENINRLYEQAKMFAFLCSQTEKIELALEPEANIVCFRYVGSDMENSKFKNIDQINLQIRKTLLKRGDFYIVQTVLNGIQYLRVSVMNPFTKKSDFEKLLLQVCEIGDKLP